MNKKGTFLSRAKRDLKKNRGIYLMAIPVLAFYICFCYIPIYGLQIAFKDFSLGAGIWGSPWAGFKHFISFFTGPLLLADAAQHSFNQFVYDCRVLSGADYICASAE